MLRSLKEELMGGPDYRTREHETELAMKVAGVEWEQWDYPDTDPNWRAIHRHVGIELGGWQNGVTVIGPAWEEGGHEQHNELADILNSATFGDGYIRYLTYKRGFGRTEGIPVVPTAEERILKDVALACYRSQAEYPPTAPWFGSDQREFLA